MKILIHLIHRLSTPLACYYLTEQATKKRMELIKLTAMAIIQDLKNKGDGAFKDMNDWLGARYLKEMER